MLRSLSKRAIYLAAAMLALAGCKRVETQAPSASAPVASASAVELASRMLGNVYRQSSYAYPLPYRLFVPSGYAPDKRYPLVLYLHGAGGRGTDNVSQLNEDVAKLVSPTLQDVEPTFVLAPHCPPNDQWVNGARSMPAMNYVQADVPESDAAKQVLAVLDEVKRSYGIDPARIYITGHSMGGAGAWDYVTRYPGIFAAALPVNGVNDPSRASVIAKLPIWVFHGDLDKVSPVSNTRQMVGALRKLGSPVKYTELVGMGHMCAMSAYGEPNVLRWLLAQRLGAPAVDPEAQAAPAQ